MNRYEDIKVEDYERVVKCTNENTGLHAWIIIHNTSRGPSLGGCRMWNYATEQDALQDGLNLAKGMTYKSAVSELPLGGGKSVIWGDKRHKTRDLLLSMAEFVNYLNGKYIIAEDVGTTIEDMLVMQELGHDNIVNCDMGDPGPYTAWGVVSGLKSCMDFVFGPGPNRRLQQFLIQGIGSVGRGVANHLKDEGARLYINDINENALNEVAEETGAMIVSQEDMYTTKVDAYIPCALGQTINEECLNTLKAPIIAGSANNQLISPEYGEHLFHKGILYAPDYVINAGGIILACEATFSGDKQKIMDAIAKIGPTLIEVFERSRDEKLPTNVIADRMAEERFTN